MKTRIENCENCKDKLICANCNSGVFVENNEEKILTEILAYAESMSSIKQVRNLLKEYILKYNYNGF